MTSNTIMPSFKPISTASYSLEEARQDFGPCGTILHALHRCDPADMDAYMLFGLEACWKQHQSCHTDAQSLHVSLLQPVFTAISPELLPVHMKKVREAVHSIDWVQEIKRHQ